MAVTEVVMPSMGADMSEGSIARWLKQPGDRVERGDILAEVETDKAVVEMEAYGSGVLRRVIVGEGITVPVGEIIALIADPDDELPGLPAAAPAAAAPAAVIDAPAVEAVPPPAPAPARAPGERIKASPVARKLAAERGIDLASLAGTGPGGRIVKADVDAALAAGSPSTPAAPAPAAVAAAPATPPPPLSAGDIPLTSMRQAIARTVVRSKTDAPDFYVTVAVDMTDALRLRQWMNEALADEGVRISVNDMIVKAVALAIEKHPRWNTSFGGDRLTSHRDINIGIAVAMDQGLMVPAVLRCQGKPLKQIAVEARDLGERARAGRLTQEELTGGTFSVSNLGMFGVEEFSAIIMPPQSGILAVGAVAKTPVVRDDEIVVREIMKATLTTDHRVSDGAEAATFIGEIKKSLENPMSFVL